MVEGKGWETPREEKHKGRMGIKAQALTSKCLPFFICLLGSDARCSLHISRPHVEYA